MSTQTMTPQDVRPMLTPAEAARLASVSTKTVYREIDRGSLRALHVGGRLLRIDPYDFRRWLERGGHGRLTRVAPVSRGNGPVASAAGPVSGVGMADQALETPEARLYTAGFTRQLEFWVTPDGERVLNLNDAIAALDAGEIKPAGLAIPAFPDQPGFRELTPEAVDAMADRLFRPPPPPPPDWLEPLAELVVQKLKPVVRADVRAALRAEAGRRAGEPEA